MPTLERFLVNHKVCSWRTVKSRISAGRVRLNGLCVSDGKIQIDSADDCVEFDGKILQPCRELYFMLNKKAGFVCSSVSDRHKTVYSIFPEEFLFPENLSPLHCIGRLDCDTEGLLILTTDGEFSHYVASPDSNIIKTYSVTLANPVSEELAEEYSESFMNGVMLPAEKKFPQQFCSKAEIVWDGTFPAVECSLSVSEGKFHEVKRLFRAVGNDVVRLKRTSIGSLKLDSSLEPGEYRELSDAEIELLRKKV